MLRPFFCLFLDKENPFRIIPKNNNILVFYSPGEGRWNSRWNHRDHGEIHGEMTMTAVKFTVLGCFFRFRDLKILVLRQNNICSQLVWGVPKFQMNLQSSKIPSDLHWSSKRWINLWNLELIRVDLLIFGSKQFHFTKLDLQRPNLQNLELQRSNFSRLDLCWIVAVPNLQWSKIHGDGWNWSLLWIVANGSVELWN